MKKSFYSKIAGVSHDNDDGSSRQALLKRCRVGEVLRLVRDCNNRYDPSAVKICRRNGTQLGFLPAETAEDLVPRIDAGCKVRATITELTGGTRGQPTRGANILVTIGERGGFWRLQRQIGGLLVVAGIVCLTQRQPAGGGVAVLGVAWWLLAKIGGWLFRG